MEKYKNNTIIEFFEKDYYDLKTLKTMKDEKFSNLFNTLKNDKLFLNFYKKTKSLKEIIKAGFFSEKNKENYNLNIFTTPYNKLNLKKNEINYILLTTGGFAPIHIGHINMLEESKKYCESLNLHIAGGYISPSHDDYVLKKKNQLKEMNIFNRLNIANKELLNNNWIMVDPFEGAICKSSINYTKVIDRLKKYLQYHFKDYKFEIIYCYGSDNVDFRRLFEANKIKSICVNRDENLINEENEYTKYINNYKKISSSDIRKDFKLDKIEIKDKFYYLRDDLDFLNIKNINNIRIKLSRIFNKNVKNIKLVKIKDEVKFKEENIISLDFYTEGKYNLNYSRLFNLCDNQIKSDKLVNRINYQNNIENINTDLEYILLDDDISSGKTINYIKSNILNKIKIKGVITIIDSFNCYDVNDLRDFIFGSKNGGLTCSLPNGEYVRVPYIYPYIDLHNRASIEQKNVLKFSKEIIELNIELYKNKKIKEFDNNFIIFLEAQGYSKESMIKKYLNDLLAIIIK